MFGSEISNKLYKSAEWRVDLCKLQDGQMKQELI